MFDQVVLFAVVFMLNNKSDLSNRHVTSLHPVFFLRESAMRQMRITL